MERITRVLQLTSILNGSVENNLRQIGFSSSICTALRKEMGLVYTIQNGEKKPLRLVDFLDTSRTFYIVLKDFDVNPIPRYNYPLDIVFEDDDVAVIDKPSGMAVIPTHNHYGKSLPNALANIWGDFVYRPVNRLDRDTSGLMIVAKNQLAHSILSTANIVKKYHALCLGILSGQGEWDFPITDSIDGSMKRFVSQDGKPALTKYKVLQNFDDYTLIECELVTGRTHQIRVHSAHSGHPLVADKLYGDARAMQSPNGTLLTTQALHSCHLEFISPLSNQKVVLDSKARWE